MAIIKDIKDIETLLKDSTRKEAYAKVKATIDAANKRLKRQGSNIHISTRGKDVKGLIEAVKQAVNVSPTKLVKQSMGSRLPIKTPLAPIIEVAQTQAILQETRQAVKRTVKQLPNDFRSMTRSELYKAMKPTIDTANKRAQRLSKLDVLSPAYQNLLERGGKFSTKGLTKNELIKEASRAIAFLNMPTSTVSGAKTYEKKFVSKLSNKSKGITVEQRKALFDGFRKLEQISPMGMNLYGSDRLIRMLADEITDGGRSFDDMMDYAIGELNKAYEDAINEYEDDIDIWDL